jgi:LPS-assembly protein
VFNGSPIYFSFDSTIGALKKEESVDTNVTLVTPAAVQRFDFQPKVTVPLATIAGVAITPSLSLRETYYTSSLDPKVPAFDPQKFTFDPVDPRLDPLRVEFRPDLKLFDRNLLDPIIPSDISRHYAELAVDVRPPALEKTYTNADGSSRFKHLIEPYITYRLISGIGGEFNHIIRFDESDAVANTNEFEYAIVNRFFVRHFASDLGRRRSKARRLKSDTNTVQPKEKDAGRGKGKQQTNPPADVKIEPSAKTETLPSDQTGKIKPAEPQNDKSNIKLEMGKQDELSSKDRNLSKQETMGRRGDDSVATASEDAASNEGAAPQAYEVLTIKVAQKYFFDRNFGGALIEGRRNQFYPINTLSGFTFGGRARNFSPVNVAVRYRPLATVYGDLRMDLGNADGVVRNLTVGGGVRTDKVSVSANYYLSRRIKFDPNGFEPGTFTGDQVSTTVQLGDDVRGLYGGSRISYDFTNRFISDTDVSRGRLMNSRSYLGYSWDCCGVQFNYNTFKAGLRSESAWSFTFNLAGLGSYGTDQFSQLGGGQGGRGRGKRGAGLDDYLP